MNKPKKLTEPRKLHDDGNSIQFFEPEPAAPQEPEPIVSHEEDPMLTYSQSAELIGRSSRSIARWVNDGLLRAVRDPSGLHRIRRSELAKFYSGTALAGDKPING